jgi:hypothetical protein
MKLLENGMYGMKSPKSKGNNSGRTHYRGCYPAFTKLEAEGILDVEIGSGQSHAQVL